MLALYQRRAAVHHLAEAAGKRLAGLYAQGFEGLGQPLVGMSHEAVVVRTGHADVHIVVPGYETMMANGTQHGACPAVIGHVVLAAHTVNRQQYLQNM